MTARPSITRQAPAKNRNRSDEVVISSIAAPVGLPVWLDSRRPSSSAFSSMMSAILSSARLRVWGVVSDHDSKAVAAASTARSTSARARRGDGRDDLARGRVLDVQRLPRRRVDPLAADELLVRLDGVEGLGHRGLHGAPTSALAADPGGDPRIVPLREPRDQRRPSRATPRSPGRRPGLRMAGRACGLRARDAASQAGQARP